jgi:hypothetical protein
MTSRVVALTLVVLVLGMWALTLAQFRFDMIPTSASSAGGYVLRDRWTGAVWVCFAEGCVEASRQVDQP